MSLSGVGGVGQTGWASLSGVGGADSGNFEDSAVAAWRQTTWHCAAARGYQWFQSYNSDQQHEKHLLRPDQVRKWCQAGGGVYKGVGAFVVGGGLGLGSRGWSSTNDQL